MTARRSERQEARRMLRRLVGTARRRILRRGRTTKAHAGSASTPTLTVVVDATDEHGPFLPECLSRVLRQAPKKLEVLVVAHGECADVRDVAERYAARDHRVTVLVPSFPGRAEARNFGAARARGTYLAFVTASDVVAAGAYKDLVRSLRHSGSDLAFGRVTVRRMKPDPSRVDFERDSGTGLTLAHVPAAISDLSLGNHVFRRAFWDGLTLSFDPGSDYHEALPVAQACVEAAAFDIVDRFVYQRNARAAGQAVGTVRPQMPIVDAWWQEINRVTSYLSSSMQPGLADVWLLAVLDGGMAPFVDDSEGADPHQWATLHLAVHTCLERIGAASWADVRAENKVKAWLVANDRRADLEEFVATRRFERPHVPTRVDAGTVLAELPFFDDPARGVSPSCYRMAPSELPLVAAVHGARWVDEETLELDVFAHIKRLDMGSSMPEVTAVLCGGESNADLAVRQRTDPAATAWANDRYQQHDNGAFTVTIDANALVRQSGSWTIAVEMEVAGVRRRGPLHHMARAHAAQLLPPRVLAGVRLRPARGGSTFTIEAVPSTVRLDTLDVDHRTIAGRLLAKAPLAAIVVERGGDSHGHDLDDGGGGEYGFSVTLPDTTAPTGGGEEGWWTVRAVTTDGERLPIAWPSGCTERWLAGTSVAAVRSSAGNFDLEELRGLLCVHDVRPNDDEVVLDARWVGTPPDRWELRLESSRLSLAPVTVSVDGADVHAVFPTTHDRWGRTGSRLRSDRYRLVARARAERLGDAEAEAWSAHAVASDDLLARTPVDVLGRWFRFQVRHDGARSVAVHVSAPLSEAEVSNHGQTVLRRRYQHDEPFEEHAVYFQAYDGTVATDTELALHRELRLSGTDLTLYWGVADHATVLPEGAVPLVIDSAEWYERLARARYLVSNIDFPRWFAKKPHQRYLQTFHGYPSKAMGIGLWQSKNFSRSQIAAELDRTSRHWDLIVTPCPQMNEHYRREYDYDGPIFDQGYPRDDVLVSARAAQIRSDTRRLLRVEDHQTVVLYAPTWRDDVATAYDAAPMVNHLDLDEARAGLGPDFVLLVRGHRFHTSGSTRRGRDSRVVDVTDHPEINDLILAADVGVFDYSSIRFDFALTGKPMLFLVPDLGTYSANGRGFLFDFDMTAPGPFLGTTAEVLGAIRDLAMVQRKYRTAYKEFNERYNAFQDGQASARLAETMIDPNHRRNVTQS